MIEALTNFSLINKIFPKHVILMLEGGQSYSKVKKLTENIVKQIKESFEELKLEFIIKITIIMINKKNNLRIFSHESTDYNNPIPGMLI